MKVCSANFLMILGLLAFGCASTKDEPEQATPVDIAKVRYVKAADLPEVTILFQGNRGSTYYFAVVNKSSKVVLGLNANVVQYDLRGAVKTNLQLNLGYVGIKEPVAKPGQVGKVPVRCYGSNIARVDLVPNLYIVIEEPES